MPSERRDDCPWCGSKRLRAGTRAVDECRDCAHVFQNPRLTPDHGSFEEHAETCPAPRRHHYSTARAMLRLCPEPESWLDVGTGDARFPETAKELFPYTSFDGLDPTPRVEQARREDRIEEAHVGNLTDPDITARLRARYDVVSLLHHLHRTPDPREELRAALAVLRKGGHLLIETPDPQSAFAALLGKRWIPRTHRSRTHLTPLDHLRTELESLGCTVLSTNRSAPHRPNDLSAAVPRARALAHKPLGRATTSSAATATALDHTLSPALSRTRFSNAYRIIARRAPA